MAPPPKTAIELARWEVLWRRNGRRFAKKFGTNYADAEELYFKLIKLGAPSATLRCTNVGFPPPARYQPQTVWVKKKGRRKQVFRVPMRLLNAAGLWWCPYCRRFRRFVESRDKVGAGRKRPYWHCPMCKVRHTNYYVYTHNPLGNDLMFKFPHNYKTPRMKKVK